MAAVATCVAPTGNLVLEVCVDSVESATRAAQGGCGRVELCSSLAQGGITPSIGLVEGVLHAVGKKGVKVFVLIRPRGGDFCYTRDELSTMQKDIRAVIEAGAHGIVVGALTPDGDVDMLAMRDLISSVKNAQEIRGSDNIEITFHRAIDMSKDPVNSVELCVELGVHRILTSGGAKSSMEGAATIQDMLTCADNRLVVMAGGGVTPDNVKKLVELSGVKEVHGSLRSPQHSLSVFRKEGVSMGNNLSDEYERLICDESMVADVVARLRDIAQVSLACTCASNKKSPRVVIVPGNGCTDTENANWYSFARDKLASTNMFEEVVLPRSMPDPYRATETVWLKYLLDECHVDDGNTIVIGHSSGAVAAMRLLENTKLLGAILVAACWTDLGEESERISGYYSRPWLWDRIKSNAGWLVQFHSRDDPFIPVEESRHVAASLGTEYYEFDGYSHFFEPFDELINELMKKV